MIRNEEHQLVFFDRPPQREAELVLVQHPSRLTLLFEEIIVCVQSGIAEVFPKITVESVGTRLGDHIHICAGIPPIRGIVLPSLHLELRNRVRIGNRNTAANSSFADKVIDFGSVHLKIVVVGGIAAGRVAADRSGLT